MMLALLVLLACEPAPITRGVYRSGPNAVVQGVRDGELRVWGKSGTVVRVPTASARNTLLGQSGPLWVVDRDVPAPPKSFPVDAALVERIGFHVAPLLGSASTGATDPARAGGAFVRTAMKIRRSLAPPVYLATATRDDVGAGRMGGPADVREGTACESIVALFDAKAAKILSSVRLDAATRTCAVPVATGPVDIDGDGDTEVLVYGQHKNKGFRAWFSIEGDALVAGPSESWESIP